MTRVFAHKTARVTREDAPPPPVTITISPEAAASLRRVLSSVVGDTVGAVELEHLKQALLDAGFQEWVPAKGTITLA